MSCYWLAVACKAHVIRGVTGGFCQVCHGKAGPLQRMKTGDGIIYYSSKETMEGDEPCQKFTAIGSVQDKLPYQVAMSETFLPWRRDINFLQAKEVHIHPLIGSLTFIQDKQRWGYPFRRGCFTISESDFMLIATHMGVCWR